MPPRTCSPRSTTGGPSTTVSEEYTYTVTYGNRGDQDSAGAVLTVTIPEHTTFDAGNDPAWVHRGGRVYERSVGDLGAAGADDGTVTFGVTVDDRFDAGVEDLTASVAIDDAANSLDDPTPADNSDTDVDVVSTAPDYFVTTSDDVPDGDSILPGETLIYTLAYGNKPNLQDGTGVVLTHTVPAGTGYDPANDGRGWTFKETNGDGLAVYELAVGPVASGAGGAATFSVIVDETADARREAIVAAATIGDDGDNGTDPVPADNSEPEATPLRARVDLAVTIDDGDRGDVAGNELTPGDSLTLAVTWDNLGDQDAANAVLTLSPPAGTAVSAADRLANAAAGWVEDAGTGVWTKTLGEVAVTDPAGSTNFLVTVDDPVTAGRETIDSSVSIADAGTTEPDLVLSNNAAADTDPLTATPDLILSVTPNVNDAEVGETVTYTLDFENVGDQHASGTTLTFVVPPGTVGDPANAGGGWVDQGGGVWTLDLDQVDAGTGRFGDVRHDRRRPGDRRPGDRRRHRDARRRRRRHPADRSGDRPGDHPAGPSTPCRTSWVDTTDLGRAARPGEVLEYIVTVTNVGDQAANGVRVVHTIPEGTTLSDGAIAGGWVDRGDGFAVLAIGTLTPGTPATVPFGVLVDSRQPALREGFDATATAEDVASPGNPAEADPTPLDNVDAEPTPLDAAPDYVVTVTDRLETAKPGEAITWTITLTNVGGQDGTGVTLTDAFPPDLLENVRATRGGVVDPAAGTIRWAFPALAGDGGEVVVRVVGTVPKGLSPGSHDLTHRARVTDDGANGPDPTPRDNRDADLTTVRVDPPVTFAFDSFRSAANGAVGRVRGGPGDRRRVRRPRGADRRRGPVRDRRPRQAAGRSAAGPASRSPASPPGCRSTRCSAGPPSPARC